MSVASSMRHAAMNYASLNWPVFPLLPIVEDRCTCAGTDCAGKHPASKGWQRTIASVEAAESLWSDRHGVRGIGLACAREPGCGGSTSILATAESGRCDSCRIATARCRGRSPRAPGPAAGT
jgi:hypothetical protein